MCCRNRSDSVTPRSTCSNPIDFTNEEMRARFNHFMTVYARLETGRERSSARRRTWMRFLAQIQREVELQNQGHGAHVIALREQLVGDVRASLLILMAAVGFILLIACVNVANLLLARGSSRGREVAVRVALGAGRGRIVQQVVMECLSLAALAALVAAPVTVWGVPHAWKGDRPGGGPTSQPCGTQSPCDRLHGCHDAADGPGLQPRAGISGWTPGPKPEPQGGKHQRRLVSPSPFARRSWSLRSRSRSSCSWAPA